MDDGNTWCWGDHLHGAFGDGTMRDPFKFTDQPSMAPRGVLGEQAFRTVVAGLWRACGLTTEGVAYYWGLNDLGEIVDGKTLDRVQPVPVYAPS